MRIVLTGPNGQLGQAIIESFSSREDIEIVCVGRSGAKSCDKALPALPLDLGETEKIVPTIKTARPDWIIHTAAMTHVDACEREPERAYAINAIATGEIARAASETGASMVYVSTDYVFDGEKGSYCEEDPTGPISVYGRTKLEGEGLALAANPGQVVIARTSAVFSAIRANFVTWLVGELRLGRQVPVVADQRLNPTLASDLAEQIFCLIRADARGVFHGAGATSLSRLEAAQEIARVFELDAALIKPVNSAEMAWVARRPRDSTLDVSKISKLSNPLPFHRALSDLKSVFP